MNIERPLDHFPKALKRYEEEHEKLGRQFRAARDQTDPQERARFIRNWRATFANMVAIRKIAEDHYKKVIFTDAAKQDQTKRVLSYN